MLGDILTRVARVGAMHAGNRPSPPADRPKPGEGKPPTSPGKMIKHKSFLGALAGAIAGALVAAAVFAVAAAVVTAAVALTGVTGGMGLALVVGVAKLGLGIAATIGAGDLIAKVSGSVSGMVDSASPSFGPVATGSANVFAEGLPVSRALVDTVACTKHSVPPIIAQGSESVFVNDSPAARVDDQTACGATIKEGASTVFFGSGQGTYAEIADEFSWWEKGLLIAVEFLVPPSRGMFKGIGKLFTKGPRAVLRGALVGAKVAVRKFKRTALRCMSQGFKNNKGLARFKEAAKGFLKDPVYIPSGEVIESRLDIALGQTLPLCFERTYRTASAHTGLLGLGWHDSWSEVASVSQQGLDTVVTITLAQGYDIDFTFHRDVTCVYCPHYPQFTLTRTEHGFLLWDRDSQQTRHFTHQQGALRHLSGVSDSHGNRIELVRDQAGKLSRVRHSDGIELALAWQDGYLQQIVRVDGGQQTRLANYTQNRTGQLVEADASHHYHLFYEYDSLGRLTRWHDNDQTWARYEYDAQGRCVYTTCADGMLTARFDYQPGKVVMTDGLGRHEYELNELDLVSAIRSPLGHVTRFDYDEFGNLLREISPAGRVVEFDYLNDTGLVTRFVDGSGHAWHYEYDDQQRLCAVTDPLGRSWQWRFDEAGNPDRLTGPDASEVHFSWNRHGLLTAVSDQSGKVQTRLQYDHRQRLLSQTDAEGRTEQWRYDGQDRVAQWQRADGARYQLGYRRPSWQLPEQLKRPDEVEEQRHYDRHKNLTDYVDGNGQHWRQRFGAFDLLLERTDASGRSWCYQYDRDTQQLIKVTGPDQQVWQWWLDNDGRVVREQDMAGTLTHYRYDEDGHCIEVRNGEGQARHFLFDGRGLLLRETSDDDTIHYHYDGAGRLLEVSSNSSHLCFEYDTRDRVVREEQNGATISRSYDEQARTLTRTLSWPEGHQESKEDEPAPLTTTFTVNNVGELTRVGLPDGAELTLGHDLAGREAQRQGGAFGLKQEYDALGQLTRAQSGQLQEGRLLAGLTREYGYDRAGNLIGERRGREAQGYRLDACGRVLETLSQHPSSGRQREAQFSYTRQGLPLTDGEHTQWQQGRVSQRGDIYYDYDKAGRLISKRQLRPGFRPEQWHYRWDSRNQLRVVTTPDGHNWFYRYDPFGRRISKRCEQSGEEVRYLWDGDQIAEVRHFKQGQLQARRHWVWRGWELLVQQRQTVQAQPALQACAPTAYIEQGPQAAAESWQTDFAVSQQNGELLGLYNPQGELHWQPAKASLWGLRLSKHADIRDPGLAFAGQLRDDESGLCYNRFRYYDPQGACYISPDPIGILGGENNYGYVPNPVNWIDPFGLAKCKGLPSSRKAGGTGAKYDSANGQGLYVLHDGKNILYVGRGDAASRLNIHASTPGKSHLDQMTIFDNNLTKAEAKYLEQKIMDLNGGAQSTSQKTNLLNKINSYSPNNPNASIYDIAGQSSSWGNTILDDALSILRGNGL
ncbi:type IV secretion protein Rhs [Aeromonas sp. 5HA1]|nr:type IV secretion protein Rhs [Aeromonas sp. 5HA1]